MVATPLVDPLCPFIIVKKSRVLCSGCASGGESADTEKEMAAAEACGRTFSGDKSLGAETPQRACHSFVTVR